MHVLPNQHDRKHHNEAPHANYDLLQHVDQRSCRSKASQVVDDFHPAKQACKSLQHVIVFSVLAGAHVHQCQQRQNTADEINEVVWIGKVMLLKSYLVAYRIRVSKIEIVLAEEWFSNAPDAAQT